MAHRQCEWQNCEKDGRYRIQTSSDPNDIHWFCQIHARTFDLSVVNQGPFIGAAGTSWTKNKANTNSNNNGFEQAAKGIDKDIRIRHLAKDKVISYTKEDIGHLKTLGLDTGATTDEIKKAYKKLVKHCHPDQNPDLENGIYIFNKINGAYNALKDKDFN